MLNYYLSLVLDEEDEFSVVSITKIIKVRVDDKFHPDTSTILVSNF